MKLLKILLLLVCVSASLSGTVRAATSFFLKNGDRVCFYGDSITEQRFYTVDVETYVRTRFPGLHVQFVNSGVGGDRVGGGWAGSINLRLRRDVFPFKPNVVTIMLGMNDAKYRPFNQAIFDKYRKGYKHLIASLESHLPGVRIVLIGPSAYDDITEKPGFPGGYNGVLIRYMRFVHRLAQKNNLSFVDFNTPLVAVLKKMEKINPKLAKDVIPGRVHPSAAGQLVMAQALLKAWGAPATVTSVSLNAGTRQIIAATHTVVHHVAITHGDVSWVQLDKALPMPIMALHENWPQFPPTSIWGAPSPNMVHTVAATALVVRESGFVPALDRQTLKVTNLPAAHYQLRINGTSVGKFTRAELTHGINISQLPTPMLAQAYRVLSLAWERTQIRFAAWRQVQLPMSNIGWFTPQLPINVNTGSMSPKAAADVDNIMASFSKLQRLVSTEEYLAARPLPCHYELSPIR